MSVELSAFKTSAGFKKFKTIDECLPSFLAPRNIATDVVEMFYENMIFSVCLLPPPLIPNPERKV